MDTTIGLVADRALLGRTSTAERVASILRAHIRSGFFPPGTRLLEDEITASLGVSRNTLREGFRLLVHERLLAHELNRGVFVRALDIADVRDLYRVRRHVECAAVRAVTTPPDTSRLAEALSQGQRMFDEQNWPVLGTADIVFHEALVALAGSPRLDQMMSVVLAELRLAFHVMADPRRFHEPYLDHNRDILAALDQGNSASAERLLQAYLDNAEQQLVQAYSIRS